MSTSGAKSEAKPVSAPPSKPSPFSVPSLVKVAGLVAAGTAKQLSQVGTNVAGGTGGGGGGATVAFPGYATTGGSGAASFSGIAPSASSVTGSGMVANAQFQFAYPDDPLHGLAMQQLYNSFTSPAAAAASPKPAAANAASAAATAAAAAAASNVKVNVGGNVKKNVGGYRANKHRKTSKRHRVSRKQVSRKQVSRKQVSRKQVSRKQVSRR